MSPKSRKKISVAQRRWWARARAPLGVAAHRRRQGPAALSPSSTPPAAARLLHSTPPRIRLATPRRSGRSSPRARLAPPAALRRGPASPSRAGRALPRRLLRAHHYMFASSLFEDAELPSDSPSTQNGYLVSVFRWRTVLVTQNTVHGAFLRLGHAFGDSLSAKWLGL